MTFSICIGYLFDEFQIICEMVHRILVREVFHKIFLRERASEPRSGDIAGNELRSAEEGKGFFSLSSQFRNNDLFISVNRRFENQFSFGKSVGALRTNFHRKHEHGEKFFASDEQNDVVIRIDRCVQAVREIHSRPLSL